MVRGRFAPAASPGRGDELRVRVWEALLPIPPGALDAYKDVAEHLGKPKASRAVANNACAIPCGIVSEMLGHATIAITLDTYSHVLPNMRDQAAAAMEDALS
jgi:integrase